MPPLPPTFCLNPPLPTLRQSFFVLAHVDAQSVKTRGPNPNPTAQAQSKRCLPLSTKTQIIMKIPPAGLPNPMLFGTFFEAFPGQCLKDSGPRPKVLKRHENKVPRVPKWRPGVQNCSPEVPRSTKKTATCLPNSQKRRRKCDNGASRSCTMPQRHHEATHNGNYALGKTPGWKKHVKTARGRVLAEGDVDIRRTSSRGSRAC